MWTNVPRSRCAECLARTRLRALASGHTAAWVDASAVSSKVSPCGMARPRVSNVLPLLRSCVKFEAMRSGRFCSTPGRSRRMAMERFALSLVLVASSLVTLATLASRDARASGPDFEERGDHAEHARHAWGVPELSAASAGAAVVLVGGGLLVMAGRRRRRSR